jgi:hypothetical protein
MSALASSMRVEDAVLISHELVGNAIDHARTQCRVTVRLAASTVRIFVSDHSSAVPVCGPGPARPAWARHPHRCWFGSPLVLERPSWGQEGVGIDGPRIRLTRITRRPGSLWVCNIPATITATS